MKRLFPWLLLLALVAGGLWWWLGRGPGEREATLYYLDPQAMYLIPVETRLPLPAASASALQGVLDALGTQVPGGLAAPWPSGSVAVVQEVRDGEARVALRLAGTAPGSGGEQLMTSAVVRTAGSLGVSQVAMALQDRQGTALVGEHMDLSAPLSPTDPGMENLYLGSDGQGLAMLIYYRLPEAPYLVPLRVPLSGARASEPLAGSFALWREGPPSDIRSFLAPACEASADLRWNGVEQGVAMILWKNAPVATPSELALRSLVLTLTESGQVRAVQLKREGPPLVGHVGPYDLAAPMPRPAAINPRPAS